MSRSVTTEEKLHALAVYMQNHVVFKPERNSGFSPPKGTALYSLWRNGKLNRSQCIAANMIYHDAVNAFGCSQGLTSSYSEYVDVSGISQMVQLAENVSQDRLKRLVESLHKPERPLLVMVVKEFNKSCKAKISLPVFGAIIGGYHGSDQARACAAGHLQAFLTNVAEFYGV
jgi:hypothetical protein